METGQRQHKLYLEETCGGGLQQTLEPTTTNRLGVDIGGWWRITSAFSSTSGLISRKVSS
jgi:hypothetical protein